FLVRAPLPPSDDDVALQALRPRRLGGGQLALLEPLRPVGEILERHAAEIAGELIGHLLTRLAGLDAAHPRLFVRLELAEAGRERARRLLPELVAADAADVLHLLEPVDLSELLGDVALAAELILARDLHHRVPVERRIIVRRRLVVRRGHGGEVQRLAPLPLLLPRVDEAVAPRPHLPTFP